MTPILLSSQMQHADRRAIDEHGIPGLVLMENASRGAWEILSGLVEPSAGRLLVLCGRGNNGGDGIALARHAVIAGYDVCCALFSTPDTLSDDAAAQHRMLASFAPECITSWEAINDRHHEYGAIVDAMLGTGATGGLRQPFADAVSWSNGRDSFRLAIDVPTGIDADTGVAAGEAFNADVTVTMAALKPGLLLNDGAIHCGDLYVVSIGTPPSLYHDSGLTLLDAPLVRTLIPSIKLDQHKYDRGKVLVIAGSRGMTGAGVMAAESAMRCGAGLTVLALPDALAHSLPQRIPPEIMTLRLPSGDDGAFAAEAFDEIIEKPGNFSAIAIGPGLSRSSGTADGVRRLVGRTSIPVVLDADGINAFAGDLDRLADHSSDLVITPHHGEMARLLGVEHNAIVVDPLGFAGRVAKRVACTVVLKGSPTVIASPDGKMYINSAGNPGMATGGSGDVLTGMIVSLIGQCGQCESGTLAAVFLHSLSGDIAAELHGVRSMVATDIIASIPQAYQRLLGQ